MARAYGLVEGVGDAGAAGRAGADVGDDDPQAVTDRASVSSGFMLSELHESFTNIGAVLYRSFTIACQAGLTGSMKLSRAFFYCALLLPPGVLAAATAPSIDHIITASGFGGFAADRESGDQSAPDVARSARKRATSAETAARVTSSAVPVSIT